MACCQRLLVRKASRDSGKLVLRPMVVVGAGDLSRPIGINRLRGKDHCGQATKGVWGMSWRQKAMKGVEGCEKLGEAVKQALIPRSLNYHVPNP